MITQSTVRVLRYLNSILAVTLIVSSFGVNLNGELFGISAEVSFWIALFGTIGGLLCVFLLIIGGDRGFILIMQTALYVFLLFTLVCYFKGYVLLAPVSRENQIFKEGRKGQT
jgi:hypothetical protein